MKIDVFGDAMPFGNCCLVSGYVARIIIFVSEISKILIHLYIIFIYLSFMNASKYTLRNISLSGILHYTVLLAFFLVFTASAKVSTLGVFYSISYPLFG